MQREKAIRLRAIGSTSTFEIPCSIFDIYFPQQLFCRSNENYKSCCLNSGFWPCGVIFHFTQRGDRFFRPIYVCPVYMFPVCECQLPEGHIGIIDFIGFEAPFECFNLF